MNSTPKFLFTTLILALLASCATPPVAAPQMADTPAIQASDTAQMEPTNLIYPSETPTLILVLSTGTPVPQNLIENYLFPDEIDPKIAEVIQVALEKRLGGEGEHVYRDGKRFFSYALFSPLEQDEDGIITAYVQANHSVFYVEQGELKEGGGGNIPAAVIMEEKENGWRVDVLTPQAGNWGSSIRKIFPEEIHPLIFDHSPAIKPIHEAIYRNIVQQAEEEFGLVFDAEKNSLQALGINDTTPSVILLTLTPTPTSDISALELDISTQVNLHDDHISIGVNLYRGRISAYQRGLLSSGWTVNLYKRELDNHYLPQNAIVLDNLMEPAQSDEFSVEVSLDQVRRQFGNTRGLVYRIVDKTGQVFFQDEIYVDHELTNQYQDNSQKTFPDGYGDYVNQGLIIGFPKLLSETVAPLFLTEDNLITVKEPRGGFHSLFFEYGFAQATGITATNDLQTLSENLMIELFPYQENGSYHAQEATLLTGSISGVSGVLQARFPHEWLDAKHHSGQKFYLRIGDKNGEIYKEAYLQFIPYVP